MIIVGANRKRTFSVASYDADAQLYINALNGDITLTTAEEGYINDFVLSLKTAGVWSKGITYYPLLGGTATTHKWNIFNPLDTDAAFRGTFAGGFTHGASGCQGNGTNGYMSTKFIAATHLSDANSFAMVFASATTGTEAGALMGTDDSSNNPRFLIHAKYVDNNCYGDMYAYTTSRVVNSTPDGSGVYILTRIASNDLRLIWNGSQVGSTVTGGAFAGGATKANFDRDADIFAIHAMNSGSHFGYSGKLGQGAGYFNGLTTTEAADLTTAINTLNTNFGR